MQKVRCHFFIKHQLFVSIKFQYFSSLILLNTHFTFPSRY